MTENNKPTPLAVMLGKDDFEAQGKKYSMSAISLADSEEFMKSNMNLGPQILSFSNKKETSKVDRWLGGVVDKDGKVVKHGYCFDEEGNPVSLEKAMEDGWNVVDLKRFLNKLCDLSG